MKYSIIIPLKDEEENIIELVKEVEEVMQDLNEPWELICVDDGSTDQTPNLLRELQTEKRFLRTITFDGNYGQSSAFDAGFRAAEGEFLITLDGDRQNDPKDIPALLKAIDECDLVCGIRVNRKDSWSKKLTSRIANPIRSAFCKDGVKDSGCSLKAYRRSCFDHIKMYNGMHRFLPSLFRVEGMRIKEVPVNHRPRTKGKTKYTFFNRYSSIIDMFAVHWMSKRQLNYKIKK